MHRRAGCTNTSKTASWKWHLVQFDLDVPHALRHILHVGRHGLLQPVRGASACGEWVHDTSSRMHTGLASLHASALTVASLKAQQACAAAATTSARFKQHIAAGTAHQASSSGDGCCVACVPSLCFMDHSNRPAAGTVDHQDVCVDKSAGLSACLFLQHPCGCCCWRPRWSCGLSSAPFHAGSVGSLWVTILTKPGCQRWLRL